tara:strand:- start:227 stop:739 length:513 start_codon:yes stop_codon:yes gene_type:complete
MPKAIRLYVKYIDATTWLLGILAMNLVFVMIAVLLYDAIMRNVINIPVHWALEFAQFTLTAYYFVGGAYSLKLGSHVRMDLIYSSLSERKQAGMDLVTNSCLLFYLGVMLFGSISSTLYAIEYGETRFSMWNPSMVPIKVAMVCALVLMILQTISIFFKDLARYRGVEIS